MTISSTYAYNNNTVSTLAFHFDNNYACLIEVSKDEVKITAVPTLPSGTYNV